MAFNPNELIIERVRSVEEYNLSTNQLEARYTQIEDPSLTLSADGTDVVDALNTPIYTFYENQQGEFSFTNSLFSLDLAANQFGSDKVLGTSLAKVTVPVTETLTIASNQVTLSYVPAGTTGAEVAYATIINSDNSFGQTYTVDSTATGTHFTVDASTKKLTFPTGTTGKVIVAYETSKEDAVKISKTTDSVPDVKKLIIHVIFHDPCNPNVKYLGSVICYRAQIDPSSIEINLTKDGKHSATYKLQKEYCSDDGTLVDIVVATDDDEVE